MLWLRVPNFPERQVDYGLFATVRVPIGKNRFYTQIRNHLPESSPKFENAV